MNLTKHDSLRVIFAGNHSEFREYIKLLLRKKWALRYDIPAKNMAMIGTRRGKVLLFKYIEKKEDLNGIDFDTLKTEVVHTGTYYMKKWIIDTLKMLKEEHPDLEFKSAYIRTKTKEL